MKRSAFKRVLLIAAVCVFTLSFCIPVSAEENSVTNGNQTQMTEQLEQLPVKTEDGNTVFDNSEKAGDDEVPVLSEKQDAEPEDGNENPGGGEEGAEGKEPEKETYSNGWHKIDGSYYFYYENVMQKGWISDIGRRYYTDPDSGKMLTGWQKIDGFWYYFKGGDSGRMLTDWQCINGNWFFLRPGSGKAVMGWQKIGNYWYYFRDGDSGRMLTGWQKIDGFWYYLKPGNSGRMLTGWQNIGGSWYFLFGNGKMATGWQNIGNYRYYFRGGDSGRMLTGWQKIDGSWYYFKLGNSGRMLTGWFKYKNNWYYLASDGKMATGSVTINGTDLWFTSDGICTNPEKLGIEYWMWVKAQDYSSNTEWLMLVDLTNNRTGVYKGSAGNWEQYYNWPCTTGTASEPTVLGRYSITWNRGYCFGSDTYTCYYYSGFCGPYLFHSGLYHANTFNPLDTRLGIRASQGCIRLALENAKWVYYNIPYDTAVITYY